MSALRSALGSLDLAVLEWMHRHVTQAGMSMAQAISHVGSPVAMTVLAFAGALTLLALGEWILLTGWVAAFTGASLIDRWLKVAIHRPRPIYAASLLAHPTWSFPSGHAMGSLVGYGMLAYLMVLANRGKPSRQRMIVVLATCLVLIIGLSRLYLGVHYLSDVVGGYAAGLAWLATCIALVELARHWRQRPLRLDPTS